MEVLSKDQKEFYEREGYLVLERRIPMDVIEAIRAEIARFEETARGMTASDEKIDLEDSHTPDDPRVRRVKRPDTQSETFAELMRSDHILAPVRDLIGPNLRLQTSKLNMKAAGYGAAIEWHQDWAFYPQTNDDVLAVGVLIDDMAEVNGPLMVFPGTHRGPIHDHHVDGVFAGGMSLADAGLDMKDAAVLTGPAGSISIHHARIVHGSAVNRSDRSRRICFYEMMAADAWPLMGNVSNFTSLDEYDARMLCGAPTTTPRLAPVPVRMPLPRRGDYGSIYEEQKKMKTRAFADA